MSFIVLIIFGVILSKKLDGTQYYNSMVRHTAEVMELAADGRMIYKETESAQRGYLITQDTTFYNAYLEGKRRLPQVLAQLAEKVEDNPQQKQRVRQLAAIANRRFHFLEQSLQAGLRGDSALMIVLMRQGKQVVDSNRKEWVDLVNEESRLMVERSAASKDLQDQLGSNLIFAFFFVILLVVVSFVGLLIMLGRRFEHEAILEQKNFVLNATNRDLHQVTKVFNHDLQEPLRKLRTFSSQLNQRYGKELSADARHITSRIDACAERSSTLVEALMQYTQLSVKQPVKKPMVFTNVIKRSMEHLSDALAGADIRIGPMPTLMVDADQMTLAVRQVLANAAKFADPSRKLIVAIDSIRVTATALPPDLVLKKVAFYQVIRFRDNGMGFENEFRDKIFVIFERLHTHMPEIPGSGVGLAITNRVMQNHSGFAQAESTPDVGTVISLCFPISE